MLAVSWFVSDLAMPMLIGVILSITLHLDVLNDRTPRPIPGASSKWEPIWIIQWLHSPVPQPIVIINEIKRLL